MKPTWLTALCKGFFATWLLLMESAVNKYIPELAEMAKRHMYQQCQRLRLTNPNSTNNHNQPQRQKGQDTYAQVYDMRNIMYTDQTGAFPIISCLGNWYLMVSCEIESNAILVEPMKNRSSGEMSKAYKTLMDRLKAATIYPQKTHIRQ